MKHVIKNFFTSLSPYSVQGQQLINLVALLIVGKLFLDVHVSWQTVGSVVLIAIVIEHMLLYVRDGRISFLSLSALLSALGLVFMIHADHLIIYAVLLSLAFLQKYLYRPVGHHVFNPSNLAVTLALFLFPYHTYVEMWQWGHHIWLGAVLFLLGFFILWRVKRLWIPIVFLVMYVPLQYFFVTHFHTAETAFLWLRIFSGGFLIYSIFMLTDPRTTPEKTRWQVVFIAGVALLATLFDVVYGVVAAHLFWALTAMSTLVPIIRIVSKEEHVPRNQKTTAIIGTSLLLFIVVIGVVVAYSNSALF